MNRFGGQTYSQDKKRFTEDHGQGSSKRPRYEEDDDNNDECGKYAKDGGRERSADMQA